MLAAQCRDIPLAVAKFIERPVDHLLQRDLEIDQKRLVRRNHSLLVIEHQQRRSHRVDDATEEAG